MTRNGLYLVAYDISCQRERTRACRVVEGFGIRIQKSVFECRLSAGMRNQLLRSIRSLHLKSGFVQVFRMQENVAKETLGTAPEPEFSDEQAVWIVE